MEVSDMLFLQLRREIITVHTLIKQEKLVFILVILYIQEYLCVSTKYLEWLLALFRVNMQ